MEPARQDPDRRPRIGASGASGARCALHAQVEGAPRPRRVENAPALVMVLAPLLGLLIWGGLIWGGLIALG